MTSCHDPIRAKGQGQVSFPLDEPAAGDIILDFKTVSPADAKAAVE